MRAIQTLILLVFLGAVALFAMQNTQAVTVSFLSWQFSLPLAFTLVAVYLLGMVSGWSVLGSVRRSVRTATAGRTQ